MNFAIENVNFAAGTISNIHYHIKIFQNEIHEIDQSWINRLFQ